MITLFYLISLLLGNWGSNGNLSVMDFGAVGDGITDDTQAINKALKAAHDQKLDLYFPAATYLCNQVDIYNHILLFQVDGLSSVTLFGDGDQSRILTNRDQGSTLLYVSAYAACNALTIRGLFFENTHNVIPAATMGVFLQGTGGQLISNALIASCRFEGFSTDVGGQGINGWSIDGNRFLSPKGHDEAKNDTEPAVYCWFFDNANGYCSNISITNNVANGYTGTDPINQLVTRRPMDGFIYGTGYGFTITGNTTSNFSEEHFCLAPRASRPNDTSRTLIANNHIDGILPLGSMDNDTTKHRHNYGIRCDISNALITGNEIYNYTYGILVRGVDYPDALLHTYEIRNNKLVAATDTSNYQVITAFLIQGNNSHPVSDIHLFENDIYTAAADKGIANSTIQLHNMTRCIITNNNIHNP